ncbi:MAG: hypothetical protein H0X45_07645, partial [Planctomycetes bacterium]|nr:hypothetical protein [Planctomycetota bacterium]
FFVRVNKTREDVLKVAGAVGVQRASASSTLEELFQAKFSEALKTVGKRMDFISLYNERDRFKEAIVQIIGRDLNGYSLEDAAIDFLEQTPLKLLNPDNILDSEGIRKIIELTAIQRVRANEIQRDAEKTIKKQDVETREAVLALERQQCDAEARQAREIATTRARESAEQIKVEAEEHLRGTGARIAAEQELGIAKQNAQREVDVASKQREGVLMVQTERVEKDRALEAVQRERAVELSRIEKEKILAVERKNIAEVIRERVAVEKTVAEEEERTKDVRAFAEARRVKDVALTGAEQHAEEAKIKEVKQAQSAEQAAVHMAKEKLLLAEADQSAAEMEARSAVRRAEGRQAEAAAEGLAKARVYEADTEAQRKRGLAEVTVKEASAKAIEQVGEAEASAIENRIMAESRGLAEKAGAMAKLDTATRGHEEFRFKLEKEVEVAKVRMQANVDVAKANAEVLATSLRNAKFEIVGGDGAFFDRFVKAVSQGRGIDAMVDNSEVLKTLGSDYLDGSRSLPADLKEALSGLGSGDLANLSVANLLNRLATKRDAGAVRDALAKASDVVRLDGERTG